MRPVDHRKKVDFALAAQTFRLLGGREYVDPMNPYSEEGEPVRYARFKRDYEKLLAR